ncbi:MAG: hypothetical protein EOP45_23460, partial [Sphingobacteriaceae bacterium]
MGENSNSLEYLKNDQEKIKYLRILRAQLSNHEQILLFYNWLSGHGKNWENDNQHFFTKYNGKISTNFFKVKSTFWRDVHYVWVQRHRRVELHTNRKPQTPTTQFP